MTISKFSQGVALVFVGWWLVLSGYIAIRDEFTRRREEEAERYFKAMGSAS